MAYLNSPAGCQPAGELILSLTLINNQPALNVIADRLRRLRTAGIAGAQEKDFAPAHRHQPLYVL